MSEIAPDGPRVTNRPTWSERAREVGVLGAVSWVVAAVIAVLVVAPLAITFVRTFADEGLAPASSLLESGRLLGVLTDTALALGAATTLAIVIGSSFAWINERTDASVGWIGRVLPVVTLLVPPLAGTVGWILLASPRAGFLNVALRAGVRAVGFNPGGEGPFDVFSWYGLVFVYTLYLVPLVYLTVGAALRNLDPSLEEASMLCGAGRLRTLRKVTVPAVLPAIRSGALLAIIFGLALLSIPLLLATPAGLDILSVRIVQLMKGSFPPATGEALTYGIVMVAFIGGLWAIQNTMTRRGGHATVGGRSAREGLVSLGRWRTPARLAVFGYVLTTTVLPAVALLVVSLQPFWSPMVDWGGLRLDAYETALLSGGTAASGFRNSLVLGVVGATVAMLLAAMLTFAARRSQGMTGQVVSGVMKLPGAISNVVVAVAFVGFFVGPPLSLGGTVLLLFLGYLVVNLPQASISAESAMTQIGDEVIEASSVCGASDGRTFVRILMPLLRTGLIAGWVFVFVLMAGDVTMSVMLASNRNPVVGFVMVDLYNNGTFPLLAAMGVLISFVSTLVVVVVLRVVADTAPAPTPAPAPAQGSSHG